MDVCSQAFILKIQRTDPKDRPSVKRAWRESGEQELDAKIFSSVSDELILEDLKYHSRV